VFAPELAGTGAMRFGRSGLRSTAMVEVSEVPHDFLFKS
jgi:hypothetical protein